MLKPLSDFYRSIVQESATSFIFGTATAFVKDFCVAEKNFFSKNIHAVRKGVEQAEHALLFRSLFFMARILQFESRFSQVASLILCSYISSRKNGILFALKSTIFSVISTCINFYI
ncbi:hypothetical protein GINT2_001566 [Glugoides intestinalis]